MRIGHVNVSVNDVDAARQFYAGALRLEPIARPLDAGRDGCWFRCGDVELHCSLEIGADNATSKRHVTFEVDDADQARNDLIKMGHRIEEGRPLPGVRRFFVRDPAGNRLELYQRDR